jgi:hypothetical protein
MLFPVNMVSFFLSKSKFRLYLESSIEELLEPKINTESFHVYHVQLPSVIISDFQFYMTQFLQ